MVTLKYSIKTDGMENLVHSNGNDGEMSLEDKIEQNSLSLKQVQDTLSKSIESRGIEIYKLQTRVNVLESQVKLAQHFSVLYERKMDDMEQISRKVNLRLKGIEISGNDSPALIMEKIKELIVNNVDLPPEIDRCHRVGSRYVQNGKTYQDVLVKFGFWRSRNSMFSSRRKFSFKVLADLTTRRMEILKSVRSDVENLPHVGDVVDFVFSDINCILKIKTKSNRFYHGLL